MNSRPVHEGNHGQTTLEILGVIFVGNSLRNGLAHGARLLRWFMDIAQDLEAAPMSQLRIGGIYEKIKHSLKYVFSNARLRVRAFLKSLMAILR